MTEGNGKIHTQLQHSCIHRRDVMDVLFLRTRVLVKQQYQRPSKCAVCTPSRVQAYPETGYWLWSDTIQSVQYGHLGFWSPAFQTQRRSRETLDVRRGFFLFFFGSLFIYHYFVANTSMYRCKENGKKKEKKTSIHFLSSPPDKTISHIRQMTKKKML